MPKRTPLTRTQAAKQSEEIRNLPRPSEEEYWASGGRHSGILQINQAECGTKGAVAQVQCVAWGWENLAEATIIAHFANYLLEMENKERAKGLCYVAISKLPVTLALPNGKKQMCVLENYIQLTNSEKWVNELVIQFRDQLVDQTLKRTADWKKAMGLTIKNEVDSRCKTREAARVKNRLAEYACDLAKTRARIAAGLLVLPAAASWVRSPAPHLPELWETVFEPRLSVLMQQQEKHWAQVYEEEHVFNGLIAKLKASWKTLPLSMLSLTGTIMKKEGSKVVYAPEVGSRAVYPPGVEPPSEEANAGDEDEDDDDDDEDDDDDGEEEEGASDNEMVEDATAVVSQDGEEEEEDSMQVDAQSSEEEEGEHNGAGGADEEKDDMFTD